MSHKLKWIFCLVICLFCFGCSSDHRQQRLSSFYQWRQDNGRLKVLCTTAMIQDLVQQIGKEHVDSLTLIQGELDPHSYQLVKGDDEKLAFAELIFYNGLGLEHGPSLYAYLTNHSQAFSLGDYIDQQGKTHVIYVREQKDPHIWMDISLWSKAVPLIVQALSQKDPLHANDYQANAQALQREMEETHRQVKEILHQIPEHLRFLVTSHDAFNYFTRAYLAEDGELELQTWQKRFAAPEGLAPESQLSAGDIKAIIEHLKQYNIHLIFPESNVSKDSIRKIVQAGEELGLDVKIACCALYGDAMGPPGSQVDSYLKMLLYNAHTLASHMNVASK